MSDHDSGDRVRRLSAAMRFLSQMHGIASEADLIQAVVQAAAVWYDLDARAYRRDLRDRDVLEVWLPGAALDGDPRELTAASLASPEQPTRVNSMADFEQLGWRNAQSEVALLPVAPNGRIRWLIVVPGPLEPETEAMLALVCRTAASVLDQLASRQAREVTDRLAVCIAEANGKVPPVADALLGTFMTATGAVRGSLAIRRQAADKPLVLAARGDLGQGEPRFDVEAGRSVLAPERLALALGLGGGADALIDLRAGPTQPFGAAAAALAGAGASVIRAWLAGIALAERRAPVSERPEEFPAPPVEKAVAAGSEPAGAAAGPARRLALKGGVVVMSIEEHGAAGDMEARRALMEALKAEIRSVDLLGQLATGEYAALLVRASESGTRSAEQRLRRRIDRLSRERGMPKVALASALYPPATGETLVMVADRALAAARGAREQRFF